VWMAENLNYKIDGSWCYDNDEANGKKYGRLYTWDAAKIACPIGWHLPSRQEWDDLATTAGGGKAAGKKLKARNGWNNKKDGDSGNGTDDFGFSALPGGNIISINDTTNSVGTDGFWWTADEESSFRAYFRHMRYDSDGVAEFRYIKDFRFSVRYLADGCGGR